MRAAFLGTPAAAVPSLQAVSDVAEVDVVVTRPDAPRGRGRRMEPSPVKVAALEMGLDVAEPGTRADLVSSLADRDLDVGVVVAFGMILPPEVLALPRHGFVNVHFSLLPRWRGAAPVERAIMAGDSESGVTIMEMDEGLDTGPIIARRRCPIHPDSTGGDLRQGLADLGADLLSEVLEPWVNGSIEAVAQSEDGVTYAARLSAEDRHLSADMTAEEARNRIRALAPAPGAYLEIEGEPHKILAAGISSVDLAPGEWTEVERSPHVGFRHGALEVLEIRPPGKPAMAGDAWLRGRELPGPG